MKVSTSSLQFILNNIFFHKYSASSLSPEAPAQNNSELLFVNHIEKKIRQRKALTFVELSGSRSSVATQFTSNTELCDINRREPTVL